jgi:hypothetical protein
VIQHRVNLIPGTLRAVHWNLIAAVISITAGLTGCAAHDGWCSPTASSEQELARVQYACTSGSARQNQEHPDVNPEIKANMDPHSLRTTSGTPVMGSGLDPFVFKSCMEKSGYRYLPKQQCEAIATATKAHERCSLGATCVDEAPPPAKVEVMGTSPAPGYIWMPGYYVYYAKTGYQWDDGHWEAARPGYHWNAPYWEQMGSKWVFTPGDWERDN